MRLVDQSDSSKKYLVSEKNFVIGSSSEADIPLENLQKEHILIAKEGSFFYVYNKAKDPFASLNSLPFSKKKIQEGDHLEVGEKSFLFTKVEIEEKQTESEEILEEQFEEVFEKDIAPPPPSESSFRSFHEHEEEVSYPANQEDEGVNLLRDEEETTFTRAPLTSLPKEFLGRRVFSKKEKKQGSFSSQYLKKALPKIFIFLIFLTLTGSLGFAWTRKKAKQYELLASEGVIDVAMALAYAKIKEIHPSQKSFTDPEFLKINLAAVLDESYPSFSKLDSQGRFVNSPYLIRIYSSPGLGHFLVIAQPQAGYEEWLAPKSALIVDSDDMCLRKVRDLKTLNRLLVQGENLDAGPSEEVSKFIKEGEPISLAKLAEELDDASLSPPKSLAKWRKGAEEYVYNAPRYYHLGENLLRLAEGFEEHIFTKDDLDQLRDEAKSISSFKDLVLYSSKGSQRAFSAEKALSTYLNDASFIIGYLNFQPDGTLLNGKLLRDEEFQEEKEDTTHAVRENIIAKALVALKQTREESLAEAEKNLQKVLQKAKETPFNMHMEPLELAFDSYKEILQTENNKLRYQLAALFSQQKEHDNFLNEVAAIHGECAMQCLKAERLAVKAIEPFLKEEESEEEEHVAYQDDVIMETGEEKNSEEQEEMLLEAEIALTEKELFLKHILENKSWHELLASAKNAPKNDSDILRALQKQIKELFFYKRDTLPEDAFTSQEREKEFKELLDALKFNSWERNFYLKQFEIYKQAASIK